MCSVLYKALQRIQKWIITYHPEIYILIWNVDLAT